MVHSLWVSSCVPFPHPPPASPGLRRAVLGCWECFGPIWILILPLDDHFDADLAVRQPGRNDIVINFNDNPVRIGLENASLGPVYQTGMRLKRAFYNGKARYQT